MAERGDPPALSSLADKLNFLFAHVRPEGSTREYTGREVTEAVRAQGAELSQSHLSELRRGIKTNPTARVLQALARFFEVRVGFFFDDPQMVQEVQAEIELRAAMRDAQVHDVAWRVAGLRPEQRTAMFRLLTDVLNDRAADPDRALEPPTEGPREPP